MEGNPNQKLFERLRSKDPKERERVFTELYNEHYTMALNLVKKFGGQEADAADVFQDSLIVLFNQAKNGEFTLQGPLQPYLFGICRNIWFNRIRDSKPEVHINDDWDEITIEGNQLDPVFASEKTKLIASLFNELGPECKKILTLFYFHRMRLKDIQKELDINSEQMTKNKKLKCMKELRYLVSKYPEQEDLLRGFGKKY